MSVGPLCPRHPWAQEGMWPRPGQSDPHGPLTPAGTGSDSGRETPEGMRVRTQALSSCGRVAATGWVMAAREGRDSGQCEARSCPFLSCGQRRPYAGRVPVASEASGILLCSRPAGPFTKGSHSFTSILSKRSTSEVQLSGHNKPLSPKNGPHDKRPRTESAPLYLFSALCGA